MAWSWLMSNFRLIVLVPTPRRSSSSSPMVHLRVQVDSRQVLPIAPSKVPRVSRIKAPTFIRSASLTAQIPMPSPRLETQAMRTSSCMPCRAIIPTQSRIRAICLAHVRKTPITTSRQPTPLSSRRSSKRSREALSRPVTRPKFMTAMASMSPATLRSPIGWATLCRSTTLRPSCTTARRLTSRQRSPKAMSTLTNLRVPLRTWSSPFNMPKRVSLRPATS